MDCSVLVILLGNHCLYIDAFILFFKDRFRINQKMNFDSSKNKF